MHGRTRKQFPLEQILLIEEHPKKASTLIVKFIKNDLFVNGVVVATGGQRDYYCIFLIVFFPVDFIFVFSFSIDRQRDYT